jgi:hypothetical protein
VIGQRLAVRRLGLAVIGRPELPDLGGKITLSRSGNDIGIGSYPTGAQDVHGLIFGQIRVRKSCLSPPIFGQFGLVLFTSRSLAITRKPLINMVGATGIEPVTPTMST